MTNWESDILKKLQKGDEVGLRQLFDMHYKSLCVYALKYIDSFDKAEDIVQEVFISFWEKKRAQQIKGGLRNYLLKSVKNNCLSFLRQDKRYAHETVDKLYDLEFEEGEDPADVEEKRKLLFQEVSKLSPQAKAIFEAIVFDNQKYKDVAEELDISVNTVKTTFARALKRLRGSLNIIVFIMLT